MCSLSPCWTSDSFPYVQPLKNGSYDTKVRDEVAKSPRFYKNCASTRGGAGNVPMES